MKAMTITVALAMAAAMSFAAASEAGAYARRRHGSPVYWGVERRVHVHRDCTGWCWPRQSPRLAAIGQVDPRLRAGSDGRLLEEVGSPPPAPETVGILPYQYGPVVTVIPRGFFWHGHGPLFWRGPARGAYVVRGRR